METINANTFEATISGGRVLVDFYADWCAECTALMPELEAAQKKTETPFFRVNCDSDRALAAELGIMSIPVLILYENGKELRRRIGFAETDEILEFIY